MARTNWLYVNLDKELIEHVDYAVENIKSRGVQKYENRKIFVTKAIQNLLDKEGVKEKAEAVPN